MRINYIEADPIASVTSIDMEEVLARWSVSLHRNCIAMLGLV